MPPSPGDPPPYVWTTVWIVLEPKVSTNGRVWGVRARKMYQSRPLGVPCIEVAIRVPPAAFEPFKAQVTVDAGELHQFEAEVEAH